MYIFTNIIHYNTGLIEEFMIEDSSKSDVEEDHHILGISSMKLMRCFNKIILNLFLLYIFFTYIFGFQLTRLTINRCDIATTHKIIRFVSCNFMLAMIANVSCEQ